MTIRTTWQKKEDGINVDDLGIVIVVAEEFTYDYDPVEKISSNYIPTSRTVTAQLNKSHPRFNNRMKVLLKEKITQIVNKDIESAGVDVEIRKVSYAELQDFIEPEV